MRHGLRPANKATAAPRPIWRMKLKRNLTKRSADLPNGGGRPNKTWRWNNLPPWNTDLSD